MLGRGEQPHPEDQVSPGMVTAVLLTQKTKDIRCDDVDMQGKDGAGQA